MEFCNFFCVFFFCAQKCFLKLETSPQCNPYMYILCKGSNVLQTAVYIYIYIYGGRGGGGWTTAILLGFVTFPIGRKQDPVDKVLIILITCWDPRQHPGITLRYRVFYLKDSSASQTLSSHLIPSPILPRIGIKA